ncbi:hypothetical protein BC830DRAFT_542943 [Chytriomyces sp. MP71]|nr:hypothetical protein BC830DRAFT_542943 [Chytriomyces sp. MP71]
MSRLVTKLSAFTLLGVSLKPQPTTGEIAKATTLLTGSGTTAFKSMYQLQELPSSSSCARFKVVLLAKLAHTLCC